MKNIVLIALGLLFVSCSQTENQPKEKYEVVAKENEIFLTDLQMKNAGILVQNSSEKELASKIILSGRVEVPPKRMASVSAPSGGYVRSSKFMVGSFVNKGEVLTVLENPDLVQLQQDYLLAKSNLGYAQKDYARQKGLNESKASSDKTTQMAYKDAQNQLVMMRTMAERLKVLGVNPESVSAGNIQKSVSVRAPISGYISAVNISLGQFVSPTDRLFEIINSNNKHLVLNVFEKDLDKIKVGQKVYAYSNQNPEKRYTAEVILIGQNYNSDGSVPIHCHLLGNAEGLIAGSFMNAEIESSSHQTSAVPDDAVVTWEGKQYTFEEFAPKKFRMVEVEIGTMENGFTEIKNASAIADKRIVTKGAYTLLMRLKNVEE